MAIRHTDSLEKFVCAAQPAVTGIWMSKTLLIFCNTYHCNQNQNTNKISIYICKLAVVCWIFGWSVLTGSCCDTAHV
jgi:hypothetical protein